MDLTAFVAGLSLGAMLTVILHRVRADPGVSDRAPKAEAANTPATGEATEDEQYSEDVRCDAEASSQALGEGIAAISKVVDRLDSVEIRRRMVVAIGSFPDINLVELSPGADFDATIHRCIGIESAENTDEEGQVAGQAVPALEWRDGDLLRHGEVRLYSTQSKEEA